MITTSVNARQSVILVTVTALLIASSPLRASESDERIESSAQHSYVFKTYLTEDAIKTESKNGAVILTGTVSQAAHSILAQDIVSGLRGVKSVDNRLVVRGETPAQHSDGWIALKVKSALMFHRNVRASKTDVNVTDGIVSLSGEASSMAQKELTTEYAKEVQGIKEVKNQMTVAKPPAKPIETADETFDDASITALVRMSLLSYRSTSQVDTKVETTDGVVTLSGIAKNYSEKTLVTKIATDVNGVSSVINNMIFHAAVSTNNFPNAPKHLRIASERN